MKESLENVLPASEEGLYPIRTVSEVTGVNAITLRAWERRYGLFKPQRTPKGHRLYSQQDILRIQKVLQMLEKGVAIGRVAKALTKNEKIEDLADLTIRSQSSKDSILDNQQNKEAPSENQWKVYNDKLMDAVNTFDIAQLERLHHEIFSLYPLEISSRSLLLPAIKVLRNKAEQLQSLSGNYHFYWHFLQQRVGSLFLKSTLQNRGKKLLLMAHGDDKADVELMLFGLPLLTHGYRVVILGSDIPFDAIPMTLSRANSDALIIYSSASNANETQSAQTIEKIRSIKTVADSLNTPVFIAGEQTEIEEEQLSKSGLIILKANAVDQLKLIDKALTK